MIKKYTILLSILLAPTIIYLTLSYGEHHIQVLNKTEYRLPLDSMSLFTPDQIGEKISLLHFAGKIDKESLQVIANVYQTIYERLSTYPSLQIITVSIDTAADMKSYVMSQMPFMQKMDKWLFVSSTDTAEIIRAARGAGIDLDPTTLGSYDAVIIDHEGIVREGKTKKDEPYYKHDLSQVYIIKQQTIDDIKVALREYELSYKEYIKD